MTFTTGNLPPSVKVLHLTKSLQPKKEGIFVFSFDAKIKNDWGSVYERLFIVTNDPERAQKTFYIIAEIYDDFESWTENKKQTLPVSIRNQILMISELTPQAKALPIPLPLKT